MFSISLLTFSACRNLPPKSRSSRVPWQQRPRPFLPSPLHQPLPLSLSVSLCLAFSNIEKVSQKVILKREKRIFYNSFFKIPLQKRTGASTMKQDFGVFSVKMVVHFLLRYIAMVTYAAHLTRSGAGYVKDNRSKCVKALPTDPSWKIPWTSWLVPGLFFDHVFELEPMNLMEFMHNCDL